MNERAVVLLSIVAAFVLATLAVFVTGNPAVLLGDGPLGVAIFLTVGVGLPQYVLYRRDESKVRLGIAVLAVAASAAVFLGSRVLLHVAGYQLTVGLTGLLLIVVVGVGLSTTTHAFVEGYRSVNS